MPLSSCPQYGLVTAHVHLLQANDVLVLDRGCPAAWLLSSCWDVHTFVVSLLGHERSFSALVIGTLLGAFAVAAALIRMSLYWVARHLHEHQIVGGAMLATGVLFGLYPFMPSLFGLADAVAGVSPVFWVVGLSVGLGARLGWRLRPRRRAHI